MTARLKLILVLFLAACLVLGAAQAVSASGSPGIAWWVLNAGGGPASSGQIAFNASLGQPMLGESSAGNIVLKAGYWAASPLSGTAVYLPLLRK